MKIIKEVKESTTLIITGQWIEGREPSLMITDDESQIDIRRFDGKTTSLTTLGFVNILTVEEFNTFINSEHYKLHCDDDFGNDENFYVVLKDYVGIIGATGAMWGHENENFDNWDLDEYFYHQELGDLYPIIGVTGEYDFKGMTVQEVKDFLGSDKGSKVIDILCDEAKSDLFGEIEHEGLGYWIEHYGYKGDEDKELKDLCKKGKDTMKKIRGRLNVLGVEC